MYRKRGALKKACIFLFCLALFSIILAGFISSATYYNVVNFGRATEPCGGRYGSKATYWMCYGYFGYTGSRNDACACRSDNVIVCCDSHGPWNQIGVCTKTGSTFSKRDPETGVVHSITCCVPTGDEVCDGLDNDCDGLIDEGATAFAGSESLGAGMVSYWPFDGEDPAARVATTPDILDGNPGTVINRAALAGNGKKGSAYEFNGVNQEISARDSDSLDTGSTFTVSAWFKTNDPSKTQSIIMYGYDNAPGKNNGLSTLDGKLRWYIRGVGSQIGTTDLLADTWYHALMSYDGDAVNLYLNGQPEASFPGLVMNMNAKSHFIIGLYHNPKSGAVAYPFDGLIDEVGLWGRALSAAEAQQVYDAYAAASGKMADASLKRGCGNGACFGEQICSGGQWSDCNTRGQDCGTCCICEDNDNPAPGYDDAQDADCEPFNCDALDQDCVNYQTVQYCKGIGDCADADEDCSVFTYRGTDVLCSSNYLCSNTGGGDNAYDAFDFRLPSRGYCDGAGSCDYAATGVDSCELAEGSAQEGIGLALCIDGQAVCADTCTDALDNDADGCADGVDADCGGTESGMGLCFDGLDNDCDGAADDQDTDCITCAVPGSTRACGAGSCAGVQTCQADNKWSQCSARGQDCGICCICSDVYNPAPQYDETQDLDCTSYNCDNQDTVCIDYQAVRYCKGIGDCADADEDCSLFAYSGTDVQCGDYLCSRFGGGDDAYNLPYFILPSRGYCDGAGSCDYAVTTADACDMAEGSRAESSGLTVCVDGQPACIDTCTDALDNDFDGCIDGADSDCGGTESGLGLCGDGIDNDCDGFADLLDDDCFECTPGETQLCGFGACEGSQSCIGGFWGDCSTRSQDCGACCICEDVPDDPSPQYDDTQDSDCGVVDCDPLDDACIDYHDMQRCQGIGACADDISDCNDFSYMAAGVLCDNDYLCSNTGGGDNAYGAADFKLPSQGYCDGAGNCDYALMGADSCDLAQGVTQEGTNLGICIDGQAACADTCTDALDNDADSCFDSADSDCGGGEEPLTTCVDSLDNDCDGLADAADPDCFACTPGDVQSCGSGACTGTQTCAAGFWDDCTTRSQDCGICCICQDNNNPSPQGDMGQDSDCGAYNCDGLDEACTDYQDVQYCKGIGDCADADEDCNIFVYEPPTTICGGYLCSNTGGGDNAYDAFDFRMPSLGYCDGGGNCDYASTTAASCDLAEGAVQEGSGLALCEDGSATCVDTCNDGISNDGDVCIDGADADCGGTESGMGLCDDGIDNDCDGRIDYYDAGDCNTAPVVYDIFFNVNSGEVGDTVRIYCNATDADGNPLAVTLWLATVESIPWNRIDAEDISSSIENGLYFYDWVVPDDPVGQLYKAHCRADDRYLTDELREDPVGFTVGEPFVIINSDPAALSVAVTGWYNHAYIIEGDSYDPNQPESSLLNSLEIWDSTGTILPDELMAWNPVSENHTISVIILPGTYDFTYTVTDSNGSQIQLTDILIVPALPLCGDGEVLCMDGTCSTDCITTDNGPVGCAGGAPNGVCEYGEGCGCTDCNGQQDNCQAGLICSSGLCVPEVTPPCPEGTTLCSDGYCRADCGGSFECSNDGTCDPDEGCDCSDCDGLQDSCAAGLTCEGGLCTPPSPPCPEGTTLCSDGYCRADCGGSFECNYDAVCDAGAEGCDCTDCNGLQDECMPGLVCSGGLCTPVAPPCPEGTTLCSDGLCRVGCATYDCNNDGICDAGEGCECLDCSGLQDTCAAGLICINEVCTPPSPPCPAGTALCSDGYCRADCGGSFECNYDAVCDAGAEGCDCADCDGLQDTCEAGLFCTAGLCGYETPPPCPEGTTLCSDGLCRINCGGLFECNNDGVCDAGAEGCNCADCYGLQDECQAGLLCDPLTNTCASCVESSSLGVQSCSGNGQLDGANFFAFVAGDYSTQPAPVDLSSVSFCPALATSTFDITFCPGSRNIYWYEFDIAPGNPLFTVDVTPEPGDNLGLILVTPNNIQTAFDIAGSGAIEEVTVWRANQTIYFPGGSWPGTWYLGVAALSVT